MFKFFLKLNILKFPSGFELVTNRLVMNHLPLCATLLGDYFGKETIYKIQVRENWQY